MKELNNFRIKDEYSAKDFELSLVQERVKLKSKLEKEIQIKLGVTNSLQHTYTKKHKLITDTYKLAKAAIEKEYELKERLLPDIEYSQRQRLELEYEGTFSKLRSDNRKLLFEYENKLAEQEKLYYDQLNSKDQSMEELLMVINTLPKYKSETKKLAMKIGESKRKLDIVEKNKEEHMNNVKSLIDIKNYYNKPISKLKNQIEKDEIRMLKKKLEAQVEEIKSLKKELENEEKSRIKRMQNDFEELETIKHKVQLHLRVKKSNYVKSKHIPKDINNIELFLINEETRLLKHKKSILKVYNQTVHALTKTNTMLNIKQVQNAR